MGRQTEKVLDKSVYFVLAVFCLIVVIIFAILLDKEQKKYDNNDQSYDEGQRNGFIAGLVMFFLGGVALMWLGFDARAHENAQTLLRLRQAAVSAAIEQH